MKKIVTIALSFAFLASAASCNNAQKAGDDPQGLDIYLYEAGYGIEWAEALIDAFQEEPWVKEKYPNLTVTFDSDTMGSRASELLGQSAKVNKFDILMGQGLERALSPDGNALDLTELVYESTVPGEDVLFKDKMLSSYVSSAAYNSKDSTAEKQWFQINYVGGMGGMIYNEDILNSLGEDVPNTTDELVAVMNKLKDREAGKPEGERIQPYVTYGASSYAQYLFYTWWAQYETVEEYNNFFNGIYSAIGTRSPQIFKQKGLLRALEVLDSYMFNGISTGGTLTGGRGLTWVNPDRGTGAYRSTQNKVLLGEALFMANGDWVDNEMKQLREDLMERDGRHDTVKMMRTPIISSIIEKLDSVENDAELSEIVSAIDNGDDYATFAETHPDITEEDFDAVYEARRIVYSVGPGHNAVIPEYAAGKDVAVDFLRFMATDKANEIFIRATNGASLPFHYDLKEKNMELYNQLTPMQQGRIDYFTQIDTVVLPSLTSFPLVYFGDLGYMKTGGMMTFTGGVTQEELGDYSSVAEMIWNEEYNYWTANGNASWNACLQKAGM